MRICADCDKAKPDASFQQRGKRCHACQSRRRDRSRAEANFMAYWRGQKLEPVQYSRLYCARVREITKRAITRFERTTGLEAPPHLQAILALTERLQSELEIQKTMVDADNAKERRARTERRLRLNSMKRFGRRRANALEADLAYLLRLNGRSWQQIADRLGYSSAGHAHNMVFGGDGRAYAPGRDGTNPTKACTKCGEEKHIVDFVTRGRERRGRTLRVCLECYSAERLREYHAKKTFNAQVAA